MLAFVGLLFFANMGYLLMDQPKEKYISYNAVSGIAIDYQDKLHTLNFSQQNHLLKILNELQPISSLESLSEELIGKIVIYQFNEPDLTLHPMTDIDGKALYFKIPEWNKEGVFHDTSNGKLKKLILDARY